MFALINYERYLGKNNNWYTIQCLLPFNLFAKRIFAFLTIWFYILFIVNMVDFFYNWLWRKLWLSAHRYAYIDRFFDLYRMHTSMSFAFVCFSIHSLIRMALNDHWNILEVDDRFLEQMDDRKLRVDFIGRYLMMSVFGIEKRGRVRTNSEHLSLVVVMDIC